MTDTFDADGVTLRRLREHVWEIDREGDMRVPGRVLASEALLEEIQDDRTLTQLQNTTHLPGIQKHAICMPDGHQGYGFPVGGVAGIDAENGCISPGAVGYDINCLTGDGEVLLEFGRRARIEGLSNQFEDERALVADDDLIPSSLRLFTETPRETVYEVETTAGDTIGATGDHPFATPEGMTSVDELEEGDTVFVHPFEGIEDERPPEFTVLEEDDFADETPQLRRVLRDRDLLPLRSTDDELNHLLKLLGQFTGDGSFNSERTWFYGDRTDLETIREDIRSVGFKPSRIYEREREYEIDGTTFERTEYSVRSTSNAFRALLERLGAPTGTKVDSAFTVPACLDRLAGWQKALYLSSFFGAEMSAPDTSAPKNFYAPSVSHNRLVEHREAGEEFMRGLMDLLADLGVETNALEAVERTETTSGETARLRFGVKSTPENLVRFFTRVGYRYSREKRRLALLAAQYLKRKEQVIDDRQRVANEAKALADGGMAPKDIKSEFDAVNDRFIERSLWGGRDGRPRPPEEFPRFDEFRAEATVRENLTIEATIDSITERGTETVYDLGVEHDAHNFLANGFVVSNCGVRMMRTNLTYGDVKGHEEELVDVLFNSVPSGLGGGGVVESDVGTVEEILDRGMDWALENGYAVAADLEHCEDEGVFDRSDPAMVSAEAKNRGRSQIGSLGSGNHFLEVQRVTDVFLDDVAEEFGLSEDQIVVLIHCGSRGLGHQVCTDYLRKVETAHQGLLEQLPNKELAAAPAGSQLAEEYYLAMGAAINYAWVNRQLVMHQTRQTFEEVFDRSWEAMDMHLIYDVAHNIAKRETHEVPAETAGARRTEFREVETEDRELFVHRKGATRAFPAGHPEIPEAYREVGQPIIIPGSMGAGSYVLRGGEKSMDLTFGSTAHGAGRLMSRTRAKGEFWGGDVQDDLREDDQVYVKAQSGATIAEEAPGVYKNVDEVVGVSDALDIGDKVARTYPVCNIKG
ncbi:MAG: RtcB family protein [Halobacteriales archaeon]